MKEYIAQALAGNGVNEVEASPARQTESVTDCIAARQNAPWSILLLAAQRQLYGEAKRWRQLRAWSVTAMAVIGVTLTLLVPELLRIIGPVGALLGIVQWLASIAEKQCTKTAAHVQEQFDTSVLRLPWNAALAAKVDAEEVIAAASRHKGDRAKLADWYSIPSGVPYPLDVLLCQRANLRWDASLRRAYANRIVVGLVALVLTILTVAGMRGLSVAETVLALMPSVGALLLGAETVRAHRQHSTAQLELKRKVEAAWEKARTRLRAVRTSDLRSIQDGVCLLRVAAPPVPDGFYWRKRDQLEREMRLAGERLWDEAKAASRAHSPSAE